MATIEYRKLFRANVNLKVNYKIASQPKAAGTTFSRNLSSIGINILIPEKLKEEEKLDLEIFLTESSKPVKAVGKAVWQSQCSYQPKSQRRYYSTGIHFLEMNSDDAIITSDFIGEILRRQKAEEDKLIIEKIEGIL